VIFGSVSTTWKAHVVQRKSEYITSVTGASARPNTWYPSAVTLSGITPSVATAVDATAVGAADDGDTVAAGTSTATAVGAAGARVGSAAVVARLAVLGCWLAQAASKPSISIAQQRSITRWNMVILSVVYDTSYAVVQVWSGLCLPFDGAQDKRQHGTFHPLYAVFPRFGQKNRIPTKIKYRSAEGKNNQPRTSCL
jgi:hypothetical protein